MSDEREKRIKARAFELWQQEACRDGRSLSHWLQAEKDVEDAERADEESRPSTKRTLTSVNSRA